jgi:hypothetical protein
MKSRAWLSPYRSGKTYSTKPHDMMIACGNFKLHVLDAQGLSVSHKRVGFAKSSKILIAKSMSSVHKIEFSN